MKEKVSADVVTLEKKVTNRSFGLTAAITARL